MPGAHRRALMSPAASRRVCGRTTDRSFMRSAAAKARTMAICLGVGGPSGFAPDSSASMQPRHVYEVRPRKDHRGADLISDALPFGRLWYGEPNAVINAIGYAKFRSRSDDAVIRVYDEAGN